MKINSLFNIASYEKDNDNFAIHHGDTLEVLKNIEERKYDLIISSPPYNIGKEYEEKTTLNDYLVWQKDVISELYRVLKPTGSIVWQVGNYVDKGEVFPLDIYFYPLFHSLGMKLRNRIIWHFDHGLHATKRLSGRYETLMWFTKSDDYTFNLDQIRVPSKYPGKLHYKGLKAGLPSGNPLGKNPSDFWTFIQDEWASGIFEIPNVKSNHPEKTSHPCQFPVELIERCVLALTNENESILDPFGGVGTSIIAALKNNRHGEMIEREDDYIKLAEKRIKAYFEGNLNLRPLGKPVHKPSGKEKVSIPPLSWAENKQGALI